MELATVSVFPESELLVLEKVKNALSIIARTTLRGNGYGNNPGMTAGIVCQALANTIPEVEYVEGKFCQHHKHAWLKTKRGVIDAIPVCMHGPVLLSLMCDSTQTMYRPEKILLCGQHIVGLIQQLEQVLLLQTHNHLP